MHRADADAISSKALARLASWRLERFLDQELAMRQFAEHLFVTPRSLLGRQLDQREHEKAGRVHERRSDLGRLARVVLAHARHDRDEVLDREVAPPFAGLLGRAHAAVDCASKVAAIEATETGCRF